MVMKIIITKNLYFPLFGGVTILVVRSYLSFETGKLMVRIMEPTTLDSAEALLCYIIFLEILGQVMRHINSWYDNNHLITPFTMKTSKYMWGLILKADPEWLESTCSWHSTITDGVDSIIALINGVVTLVQPILGIISQMFIICEIAGWQGLVSFGMVISIVLIGMVLLHWDFVTLKKIHAKTKPLQSYATHMADTFLVSILNGQGSQARKDIIDCLFRSEKEQKEHRQTLVKYYCLIDILQCVMVLVATLYLKSRIIGLVSLAVLFININRICDYSWWFFFSLNSILRTVSKWGSMEKFLEEYQERQSKPDIELNPSDVIEGLTDIMEVRICAPSGGGKTTWMRRKVIECYNRFIPGSWIYLDQRMKLLKADHVTIRQFMLQHIPADMRHEVGPLLSHADEMGISNVISAETLDKPFAKPSGGEEKRILVLKALLPVIMKTSHIKMVFTDEVTSGLDLDNWEIVRRIMKRQKVCFVTIDHHDFEASLIGHVRKRDSVDRHLFKTRPSKKVSWFGRIMSRLVSSAKEDEDDTNKEQAPKVWIDWEATDVVCKGTDT